MKKHLSIILTCIIFITSLTCISASNEEINIQKGFVIEFNREVTDYTSVIYNDTHFVPVRKIFEKMGASVFYRSRDRQIMVLSRDGDIITHIVGDNIIIVNGKEKEFENTSILESDETYIPIGMVSAAMCPDRIFYENRQLKIQKKLNNTDYHKIIQDVLDARENSNFNPENFKKYIKYHLNKSDYSMQDVIYRVNLGLDSPFYEKITTIEKPHELLVLVNKYNKLPADFKQHNLVNMRREHTVNDGKQYLMQSGAYEKYVQMFDAAKKEGLSLRALSTYRTEAYQGGLYNNKVRTSGKVYADNYSARPGHSEHQTGLAVDINSTRVAFEYSGEFKWLQKHAHEYGYILRYPKGKEWITGYSYEPWHYRYVGVDAATKIYEKGITYEEYYAKYVLVNEFR